MNKTIELVKILDANAAPFASPVCAPATVLLYYTWLHSKLRPSPLIQLFSFRGCLSPIPLYVVCRTHRSTSQSMLCFPFFCTYAISCIQSYMVHQSIEAACSSLWLQNLIHLLLCLTILRKQFRYYFMIAAPLLALLNPFAERRQRLSWLNSDMYIPLQWHFVKVERYKNFCSQRKMYISHSSDPFCLRLSTVPIAIGHCPGHRLKLTRCFAICKAPNLFAGLSQPTFRSKSSPDTSYLLHRRDPVRKNTVEYDSFVISF